MALREYDPGLVSIVVGVALLQGFDESEFVTIQRDEDAFTHKKGADGEGTRTRNRNRAGKITIKLMQSSPSNAVLSALAIVDENTAAGIVPVTVRDSSGQSIYFAEKAWIAKVPDAAFAKEIGSREWVIQCDDLVPFTAGNA